MTNNNKINQIKPMLLPKQGENARQYAEYTALKLNEIIAMINLLILREAEREELENK